MKIRTGFVSNSSSSSFIIAVRPSNKCEHCGRSDLNVIDLIEKSGDYETEVDFRTEDRDEFIKEIDKWLADNTWMEHKFDKDITWHDAEYAIVSVSYHDENINDLIRSSSDVQVIYDLGD